MTTTTEQVLSADCGECGRHFTPSAQDVWSDFFAGEALMLTSAFIEVVQLLHDHDVRKILKMQGTSGSAPARPRLS